jgi:DhnA family fructose-bisphosphate aldolase class Ia
MKVGFSNGFQPSKKGEIMSTEINLMELGPNRLCAPGLRNPVVRGHVARMLERSDGHLLSLPFDHREEHGADKYYADGRYDKADVINVLECAVAGKFAAVALLPGGAVLAKRLYPDLPVIAKLNSSFAGPDGEPHCVLTGAVEDMAAAGVEFVGLTYYYGNAYEPQMREQLALLDREAARHNMGLIVWNYPRGFRVPRTFESALHTQRSGADMIVSIAANSLVLLKEKITVPYRLEAWKQAADETDFARTAFQRPGARGVKDEAVEALLGLPRKSLIERLVRPQHRLGIGSMMSGGEIQQEDAFRRDLADGVGPDRHLGLIAGRSTWGAARYDWDSDTFDNEPVLAHARLMHEVLPTVVV